MRRMHFTSIEEVNAHLAQEVEKLNNEPIQRIKLSRNQLFDMHEKGELKSLPEYPYRPFDERFTINASAEQGKIFSEYAKELSKDDLAKICLKDKEKKTILMCGNRNFEGFQKLILNELIK